MRSYEIGGRVTDAGSSGIQAVFQQLLHGRAEVQHDLPRADAMDGAALDGPDGPGGLRAGERGTADRALRAGGKPRSGGPGGEGRRQARGSRTRAGGRGTARAKSAAPVRGAARGTGAGAGSVHTLTRAQPPPSGPRRGGTRRALLRLPPRPVSAARASLPARQPGPATGLWGHAP